MRIISRRILFFSLVAGAPITGVVAQQHINHELAPNIDVTSFQISPDDCRAVYQTNRRHSGPIGGEVYTVLIGGGTATRIGDDRNYKYTINPNGNTVLYSDSRRVYSTPILGGATTEIVNLGWTSNHPSRSLGGLGQISPDGNTLVYYKEDEFYPGLLLSSIPIAGGEATELLGYVTPPPIGDYATLESDWQISPDGSSVIYRADRDHFLAPPPSPGLQPLGNPA